MKAILELLELARAHKNRPADVRVDPFLLEENIVDACLNNCACYSRDMFMRVAAEPDHGVKFVRIGHSEPECALKESADLTLEEPASRDHIRVLELLPLKRKGA